jgi:hypothetical protein
MSKRHSGKDPKKFKKSGHKCTVMREAIGKAHGKHQRGKALARFNAHCVRRHGGHHKK